MMVIAIFIIDNTQTPFDFKSQYTAPIPKFKIETFILFNYSKYLDSFKLLPINLRAYLHNFMVVCYTNTCQFY